MHLLLNHCVLSTTEKHLVNIKQHYQPTSGMACIYEQSKCSMLLVLDGEQWSGSDWREG